jgi:methyltransferase
MSKPLQEYSKDELIALVKSLKKTKKFGLVWEDKPERVVLDCETKLPVLTEADERVIAKAEDQPTNLIIEGDNYHSLSVLNYTHASKIDFIYIDPPYNTGNKDFVYNDSFVDKEDGYRHSKWLSFMEKRLRLAKSLLTDTGVLFISIDDNEYAHLKLLCDDIFGEENFLQNFMWLHGKGKKDRWSRTLQQYVLCYAKNKEAVPQWSVQNSASYSFQNPDNDPRGGWFSGSVSFSETRSNKKHKNFFSIKSPSGIEWTRQWQRSKKEMDELLSQNKIFFGLAPNFDAVPRVKIFPGDVSEQIPQNIIDGVGTTRDAQKMLDDMFDGKVFDYPKPVGLIKHILTFASSKDSVILDFFAGSGTTGHAVLDINKEDGGNRHFILCTNNENDIAENVTYSRINRVIKGYGKEQGIPANVRYFKTDFVNKQKTNDQTRLAIVDRCTDMIRIRENTFTEVLNEADFKLFKDANHYTAIIFDPLKIPEFIRRIEEIDTTKPVNLYNFSYSSYAHDQDIPETVLDFTTCSIPESVLEVYQRIFKTENSNV